MSEELVKAGKDVTLIEKLLNILGLAFDAGILEKAENSIKKRAVNVITGIGVKKIERQMNI